ncbi:MAG: glycosyltransferase family 4 protein [Bryobacteraceae bacterium]
MSKWPVLLMVRSLDHGGCERDAAKIAVGLDRSRFDPHVGVFYANGYRTLEVQAAGVPIVDFPVRSFADFTVLRGARKMGAYVRQHRIQLIHAFDVPMDIFAAPVARWCRVPVVITSQLSFRDMYGGKQQMALRLTDRLSDSVVVNSRAVGNSLGLPREKIYLCYNGVNPAEFYPPTADPSALVVGSVCVMRPEKRMDWVIQSFAAVRQMHAGIRLLLVGDGPELPRLKELRDRLGLQDVCHFEPGRADVAGFMRSIDIYVNSSSSESFPNGLLEAMACGCCVIGSNVGGIPELVTHMADGLVFDSRSADTLTDMLRLAVSDVNLRQKLREQAAVTARERFSIRITLQRTEALYQTLLEQC